MSKQKNVFITRTIDGQRLVGEVPESTVSAWAEYGWTVVDDEGSETDPVPGADDHPEAKPEKAPASKDKEK